jgi:hypothetical protein
MSLFHAHLLFLILETFTQKKTTQDEDGKLLPFKSYFLEILLHSFDSTSLRRREAQVSLWEIVEHFNFINGNYFEKFNKSHLFSLSTDFLLILRMSYITHLQEYKNQPTLQRIGCICKKKWYL